LTLVRRNGEAAPLPARARCPTGRIARRYLTRAGSQTEEIERIRRLLAYSGRRSWGLTLKQIGRALCRSKQQVHRGLPDTEVELREITRAMGLSDVALLGLDQLFSNGEGI
jgi:hypothetical protein